MLLAAFLSFLFASHTRPSAPQQKTAAPAFVKPSVAGVVLIILENGDRAEALDMSFLKDAHVRQQVLLTNYAALAHPSRPNYVGIVSGSIAGIDGDREPKPALKNLHLGDLLRDANRDWRVYAESYPGNCALIDEVKHDGYARRHLGFLDFADVQQTPALCQHIVTEHEDLTTLQEDIKNARVPPFVMIIPNNFHNGHDAGLVGGPVGAKAGVANADHWLTEHFKPVLTNTDPKFQAFTKDRVFIITYDENEKHSAGDHNLVFIDIWGDPVLPTTDTKILDVPYDHFDLLRTIEALLDLGSVHAGDERGRPVGGIWQKPSP